jgi:two-component system sensor histidine kinase UhpB
MTVSGAAGATDGTAVTAASRSGLPLFWRVCTVNGAVFAAGTAVLAASPATVSTPVLAREALVLAVGLTVIRARVSWSRNHPGSRVIAPGRPGNPLAIEHA